ncbi:hypothetical protein GIB67_041372 [Kingdonia uniflora]|uniref:Uncharacterized protein n=1 Tax=Kingdonia uniflora TaxID=39325 RepID=A0A7J7NIW7_9MAGN|nr:hypothetical protein GIB67_041372 [Kingdonia uniflora]
MKSLVFRGNGCTVFDSKGDIVYRIDNYEHKCNEEVYLMDLQGKVVVSILKRVSIIFFYLHAMLS